MKKQDNKDYLLGVSQTELERLRFQHGVWKKVTDSFLDRLNVGRGWKCLDAGSGPGFVTFDLRERTGEKGEVTGLEPSEFYVENSKKETEKRVWKNVKFISSKLEEAALPQNYYDLIFSRWVIGFVPDAENFLKKCIASLKPGGIIAIQDYNYEGLFLFPKGGKFDIMPEKVKEYYRSGGGDPYIAAAFPGFFRKYNIELIEYTPVCLAGGPESGVFLWAEKFFMTHTQAMAERGIITQNECDEVLADWNEHRKNPDSVFFSPIVVDIAGKKQ
jgi:ubiquinone/menaquinone biosynthesis C-methylase UbiE